MTRSEERERCREMMRAERRAIRRLLPTLTAEQWETPSLCGEWTVREVVVHLVGWDELIMYRSRRQHIRALSTFAWLYATSLASMDRLNGRLQRRTGDLAPAELIERFGADDGDDLEWLFDGTNPGAHLAENVIHGEDIRRPLGIAAEIHGDHVLAALEGSTQLPGVRLRAWRTLRRTRLEATDVPWGRGRGPVTSMRGIDLLMHLAGRRTVTPGS